ncbi:MAG: hypothetical protein IJ629_03810 [Clostridia bacterium]|nr:hypothetical protein [Clostridia bacterium]
MIKGIISFLYLFILIINLIIVVKNFILIKNKKMSGEQLKTGLFIVILLLVIAFIIGRICITRFPVHTIGEGNDKVVMSDSYYITTIGTVLMTITIIGYVINYIYYMISKNNKE